MISLILLSLLFSMISSSALRSQRFGSSQHMDDFILETKYAPYMKDVFQNLFAEGVDGIKHGWNVSHSSHAKRTTLTGADVVGNFLSPLGTIVSVIQANPTIVTNGNDTYYYLQLLWVGYPSPNGLAARSEHGFRFDGTNIYQYMYMECYQGYAYPWLLNTGVSAIYSTGNVFLLERLVTSTSSLEVTSYYDGISQFGLYITYTRYIADMSSIIFEYPKTFGGIQIGQSNRGSATCSTFQGSVSDWGSPTVCNIPCSPTGSCLGVYCGNIVYSSTHNPTCGTGSVTQGTSITASLSPL